MIDQTKHERQLEGIHKWYDKDCIGTLNYVMRFGKTRVGCLIINEILKENEDARIIICVPSDIIRKQWYVAIDKFSKDGTLPEDAFDKYRIGIVTANELLTSIITNIKCDLLIVDEIHKFVTDKRIEIIRGSIVAWSKLLGLTGTFPHREEGMLLNKYCPVIDSISEEVAQANGWISNFIEYNIALSFEEHDKVKYERLSVPIRETMHLFKSTVNYFDLGNRQYLFRSDYDVITGCIAGTTFKGQYIKSQKIRSVLAERMGWSKDLSLDNDYNKDKDLYWNPNNIFDRATKFMDYVKQRNDLLNNNNVKLNTVLKIFELYPYTTICFNESTDFADRIVGAINSKYKDKPGVCYHSNISSRYIIDKSTDKPFVYTTGARKGMPKIFGKESLKNDAIDGIMSGKYKFLCTARALDEGLNIPNIKQVITTAGTANPLQYKQRNARGKTVDIYDPDKTTLIYNLYFDDFHSTSSFNSDGSPVIVKSRDRQKLITRQARTKRINWITLSELSELKKVQPEG